MSWWVGFILIVPMLVRADDASVTPTATSRPPTLHPAALTVSREHAWWNDGAIVSDLALTAEQRAQMDDRLALALQQERESHRKQDEATRAFEEALKKGDVEGAREAAPSLREAIGESFDCKSTLMLDVLSVLNGGQRQKLLASHSDLLAQPWENDSGKGHRSRRRLTRRSSMSAR